MLQKQPTRMLILLAIARLLSVSNPTMLPFGCSTLKVRIGPYVSGASLGIRCRTCRQELRCNAAVQRGVSGCTASERTCESRS